MSAGNLAAIFGPIMMNVDKVIIILSCHVYCNNNDNFIKDATKMCI